MKNIADVDKNLKVETNLKENDIKFYNVKDKPFNLYGFFGTKKGAKFSRMLKEVAEKTNDGVAFLYSHTAGGRVRFKTNSPYIAISVQCPCMTVFPHMTLIGTSGFDMYVYENGKYIYSNTRDFIPPPCEDQKPLNYESIHYFNDEKIRDITINFPLYTDVSELYVGIKEGSILSEGGKYINEKPIVYYGSSITQGGCASRPGNSYQGIVSRYFNCDFLNLGFSGSARGEDVMAEYISKLDMCAFVYDYDHNAPTIEHLKNTHKKMFDKIRSENPDLPIIIMSSIPTTNRSEEEKRKRNEIIRKTFEEAIKKGDKNVYYIDGKEFFKFYGGECELVDGLHPNDLGFMCMAQCVIEKLKKAMNW